MIFKCKICGGDLNIERGQSIVECEYCGVKQTLPKFLDENTKLMYDRANSYLMHNEFDKAENIYNQILFADKEDADAYWSLVLCKYGISYVKDPKTGKYIPTCNRTYYSSIFDDENYKNAIKYANEEKTELFETYAKTIDDIQNGIIAISKKEKPFDIFVSYKETGLNGGRTKESIAAQDLYEKLTAEGYKVFFSRITLEDKIGTEYEPYIYAALASSKVMITVCSSKENIESVWVKNEWSRFLSFAQKDSTKTILPLYFDMEQSDLPGEFAHLPSYNMKTDGFEQDLLRGIKKLIPLPIMEKERREKQKKIFKKIGISAAACLVIAAICMIPWFMKLPDYNAAMQLYYDKNYPEATWAFDELGSYRNAKSMKDKCERSWRNDLAVVAVSAPEYSYSDNNYYVSANNSVKQYSGIGKTIFESTIDKLQVNEHEKIASLAWGYEPYVLYSDGTVQFGQNKEDVWTDIVQIVSNGRLIGLRSNGTVVYNKTIEENNYDETEWLKEIRNWKNIIALDCTETMIIGLKNDGSLCKTQRKYARDISVENYGNIKKISAIDDNLCAITNDEKIIFNNGDDVTKYKADSIETAEIYGDFDTSKHYCELTTQGELFLDDKYIIGEICYLKNGYALAKSGVLYIYDKMTNSFMESVSNVYVNDEWK